MNDVSRRKAIRLSVLGVGMGAMMSACASIPTEGSANNYAEPQASATFSANAFVPDGPRDGASPQEIVDGFLQAGAGVKDDFGVARSFLTQRLSETWKPDERILVYNGDLPMNLESDSRVSVVVPVVTQIDNRGLATSYTDSAQQDLSFGLSQVDGQWRISEAPDGLVLDRSGFDSTFYPFTLYFYDPSFSFVVPDIRWFANRSAVVTALVRAMVQGPAPYLEGAVKSAIPEGTSLVRNSVPVTDSKATVSFEGQAVTFGLDSLAEDRLAAQISLTLTRITGVTDVHITLAGQTVDPGSSGEFVEPVINPSLPSNVIGFDGDKLVVSDDIFVQSPHHLVLTEAADLMHPAMSYSRSNFAVLDSSSQRLGLVKEGTVDWVLSGSALSAPSFDRFDWVWTVAENGSVQAVNMSGEILSVEASWLDGVRVDSLNIARDAARAVICGNGESGSTVWVAGIIRDEDFAPLQLVDPVQVGTGVNASAVDWHSDSGFVVANFVSGESEIVSLSGEQISLSRLTGLSSLCVGAGDEEVLAESSDGSVWMLVERGWRRIETPLSSPNFSG